MTEPWELQEANLVLGLCERFHALPSEVVEENASVLRLLAIAELGKKEEAHG